MIKFQIFGWILAEICLKCIVLVIEFQKSPSAGGSPPSMYWFEVAWFGQIVFFQIDYDKIELNKTQLCRHHNYVTEKRNQNNVTKYFHFASPIKIYDYASIKYIT